jgi:hypothetical protein
LQLLWYDIKIVKVISYKINPSPDRSGTYGALCVFSWAKERPEEALLVLEKKTRAS